VKNKIAILYICTGKYKVFWKDFYMSSEKHFFNNDQKHYFVFTDATDLIFDSNVTIINKKCEGFPHDSLFRFDMFLEIEKFILEYDYVFFFNANMLFLKDVNSEIFPCGNFKGLIGVIHPLGHKYKKFPSMFTYERNKKSLAYIKKENKNFKYYMGGLNGGTVFEYYEMVKECSKNIHIDYNNNIVAVFHDESHLNKYYSNAKVHSLSTSYGYPEGAVLTVEPIVIIRNKLSFDDYFDKHKEELRFSRLIRFLRQIYQALTW
jgi:hypothetical protein